MRGQQTCPRNNIYHCQNYKTLIMNANAANIKQLFAAEKLSTLSRDGPLVAYER